MMPETLFFSGWGPLVRTLIAAMLGYPALLLVLRLSGKRTLAQLNAFDFVVTVALGSTLATLLVSNNVSLLQGIEALSLLVALQYLVAWLSVRASTVRSLARSSPRMLLYDGKFLHDALLAERITEDEVLQALRAEGVLQIESAKAVVLETNGHISVLEGREGTASVLQNVSHPEGG